MSDWSDGGVIFETVPANTGDRDVFGVLTQAGTVIANVADTVGKFYAARDAVVDARADRTIAAAEKGAERDLARYRLGANTQIEKYRLDAALAQARDAIAGSPALNVIAGTARANPLLTIALVIGGALVLWQVLKR